MLDRRLGPAALAAALLFQPTTSEAKGDSARSQRAGYIPNELVDTVVDEPLKGAESVFDVYAVLVNWLKQVYPEGGEARKAIDQFGDFVAKYKEMAAKNPKGLTVEMPMPIDSLMRVLRAEAPGVKGEFQGASAQNIKAQVLTAAILPFLQMRGITYRLRPMIEKSFVMHSAAINALRSVKHEITANAGKNALAIFEYLTYPMAQSGRTSVQFFKPSEVQAWVESDVIPTLDVSIKILEGALAKTPDGATESLDLSIFLKGDNPFPDAEMEYGFRYFAKPELQNLLAMAYGARAGLRGLCVYNLDQFSEATNELSHVLISNFFKEKVPFGKKPRIGTPSQVRFNLLSKYSELGTLRNAGQSRAALADLRDAWRHYDAAMSGFFAANASQKDDRITNLRWVHASYREYETKVAPQIRACLAGPTTITDYVGGASIDVDVAGFLASPPADLKKFFPSSFDATQPYREFDFSSGKLAYANYDFGNPTGWDQGSAGESWKKLFPNLGDETSADGKWIAPMKAYRDISRTYIGGFIAPLLLNVVN